MTVSTHAIMPLVFVIRHNGEVSFKELASELINYDNNRFESEETVDSAIREYSACLVYDGQTVKFNKDAKKYIKDGIPLMERYAQAAIHNSFPEKMEKFALYPYKNKKDSERCYMDVPWSKIPESAFDDATSVHPSFCDFRGEGTDACTYSCGIEERAAKYYKRLLIERTEKTTIDDFIAVFEKNRGVNIKISVIGGDFFSEILGVIDQKYDFKTNKKFQLNHAVTFSGGCPHGVYEGSFDPIKNIIIF